MSESIDLDAYFARIGYSGPRKADLSTLKALADRHPKSIPFENLDPLMGIVPQLDVASLQAKLVTGRRGGYCYEQNGLLEAALLALGFDLVPLAGRVQWGFPPDAPLRPRTHRLLKVTVENEAYLVDVGFGGMVLTAPLAFDSREPQDTGHGVFRLQDLEGDIQLQAMTPDGWAPKYRFTQERQVLADYGMANWFNATHPNSAFKTDLICSRVFDDRRLGLWNGRLSVRWTDGAVEKQSLTPNGLERVLVEQLGLPEAVVAAAKPKLQSLPV